MPLSPNFSTSESLSTLENVTFLDTSTGSDVGLTSRRISVLLANGNYLTAAGESTTIAYITWPIADLSLVVDLLTSSTTARVTVDWLTGSTVTYTKTLLQEWDLYDYVFAFQQGSNMTANPGIIQDQNYYSNFFAFITNIWNSENAVEVGDDLYSSQGALDVNQNMINNSSLYF